MLHGAMNIPITFLTNLCFSIWTVQDATHVILVSPSPLGHTSAFLHHPKVEDASEHNGGGFVILAAP